MCERYTLYANTLELTESALYGRPYIDDPLGFDRKIQPRYNIAPGAAVPVVRQLYDSVPVLVKARWGLVPRTSPTPATDLTTHTARADKVAASRLYGASLRRMRCLVPASGWYAFKNLAKHGGLEGHQAYYVRPREAGEICFAGIWDRWRGADAEAFESFSIITVPHNGLLDYVCARMPAVVARPDYRAWLDPGLRAIEPITAMIRAPARDAYQVCQVSERVSDTRHDDENLIQPMLWGPLNDEERWEAALDYTEEELQAALAKVEISAYWREKIQDMTPRDLLRIAREIERNVPAANTAARYPKRPVM